MKSLKTFAVRAGIIAAAGIMAGCPYDTETNEVGVRYCKLFCGDKKVAVVPPGRTEFLNPLLSDWYTLPISMQNFYMAADPNTGDRKERDDLIFKTKEGNDVGQDVVMTWKLEQTPECAQKIVEEVGADILAIKEKFVRPIARSIIRDYLNHLTSSEFYEGQRRFEQADKATEELRARFAPYCIHIDKVNLQDYRFEDQVYQKAINEVKNAGVDEDRYQEEKGSQMEHWRKEFYTQKGKTDSVIEAEKGAQRKATLSADAAYVKQQQDANAILKEKSAEAEGKIKLRQAMNSRGGDTAVLMEYVGNFNPEEIIILPCESGNGVSFNRLDLNALIGAEAQGK